MNVAVRLNRRLTRLATGRHLASRTVRRRLTLLYGGLFLLSGAALMAIAYALLVNAGFVFTLKDSPTAPGLTPARLTPVTTAFDSPGTRTHPSARTMAHWSAVAACMRRHGIRPFPNPTTVVPRSFAGIRMLSDRDGAILVTPATVNMQSPAFEAANTACGFMVPDPGTVAAENHRRTQVRAQLLLQSGIALAGMSLLSLALGWLVAGRVLAPLEDSYEAQRQFVANASHELRAPLTRQRALIEVALADADADAATLRASQERVLAAEQHLEEIIDGLLTLTRGQAGPERREDLDLAAVTAEALLAREPQFEDRGLALSRSLAPAPTNGDPRLVERLIGNLIDNAVRHNASGGSVQVATGTRDRRAFVSVSNTGPVVPVDELERLFRPFQRLGAARAQHAAGHGLGLSIVRAIADAHGAELSPQARPEGGLRIEVGFPAAGGRASRLAFVLARARSRREGPGLRGAAR
jgi:signal transduction histidine kinase